MIEYPEETRFSVLPDMPHMSTLGTEPWPRVHKAFQNQDQDQSQVKNSFTMPFVLKPTLII